MSESTSSLYLRDPEAAIRQRRFMQAQALRQPSEPIRSHAGGIAHLVNSLVGGLQERQIMGEARDARAADKAERAAAMAAILGAAGLGGAGAPPAAPAQPTPAAAATSGPMPPVDAPVEPTQRGPMMAGRPVQAPPGVPEVPPEVLSMTPEQLAARSAATVAGRPDMPIGPGYRSPAGVDGVFANLPPPNGGIPAIRPGGGAPPQVLAAALGAPAAAPPGPDPNRLQRAALAAALNPHTQAVAPLLSTLAGSARSDQRYEQDRTTRAEDRTETRRLAAEAEARRAAERATDNARQDEQLRLAQAAAARDEANQPVERVRQPDGSVRIVPRREAAGMADAPPAVDTFARANTLRDEYRALTGDFRTVQTAYQNIQGASRSNTGAGDMSMLYSYVKMLDPGSVVRESEFATAAASGSFGERIQGAAQRVISGERLPDSLRQSFVSEARNLFQTQRRTYDQVSNQYRTLAERNRLAPEDVVTDFITPEAAAPPPPGGGTPVRVQSPEEAMRLPKGTPIILPDGTTGVVP